MAGTSIVSTRRQGTADFGQRSDPTLLDMGELSARIAGIGLGSLARSAAAMMMRDGFEDAASITARWITGIVGAGTITVGALAFAGIGSCKFLTGAVLNNSCQIFKSIGGYKTRYGLEAVIGIFGGTGVTNAWNVDLEVFISPGFQINTIDGLVRLRNNAGTGLYDLVVINGAGAEVALATGILISNAANFVNWHYLKVVVDATTGKYGSVWLDDVEYDASGTSCQNNSFTGDVGFLVQPIVTVKTLAAQAATVYVDDLIMTRDEP